MRLLIEKMQGIKSADQEISKIEKILQRKFPKDELKFVKDKKVDRYDLPSWSIEYRGFEGETNIGVEYEEGTFAVSFTGDGRSRRSSGLDAKEVLKKIADHFGG